MARILVLDDEVTLVQTVTELLRASGHEVAPFTDGDKAMGGLEEHHPELVITDLNLERSQAQGLDVVKKARSLNPPAEVIVITAFGTVGTAVEAMRQGAYDYLEKPFKLDEFKSCAQRALSYSRAVAENHFLKRQLNQRYQLSQIVGSSQGMQEVFRLIERVADTDSTVLILGESGTGKELVARALHFNSRRQFAPFVPVNCAALPENLLESELFGHRRGAFTGALTDKKGLFQEADGGSIFLDEIGSMPAPLQSRLLRVLQDREVRRVGDNMPTYVNVRVLAATNEALEERIKEGTFREDLYYRLNVIPIQLPALRERREDIPLLVASFLREKVNPHTGEPLQITREAMDVLVAQSWPGNVRELQNAVERASVLCEGGRISVGDLPPRLTGLTSSPAGAAAGSAKAAGGTGQDSYPLPGAAGPMLSGPATAVGAASLGGAIPTGRVGTGAAPPPGAFGSLKDYIRSQELNYLNRALSMTGGDKEKAAEVLGISLATLYRKLSDEL
jgi:DNA-binding NtrC family response regulator